MLKEREIESSAVLVEPSRPTINKTRVVARNQQLVRIDREVRTPLGVEGEKALLNAVMPRIEASAWPRPIG